MLIGAAWLGTARAIHAGRKDFGLWCHHIALWVLEMTAWAPAVFAKLARYLNRMKEGAMRVYTVGMELAEHSGASRSSS
jgi:hypothetical protein